jgi:spore germination protein YaaH
MRCACVLLGLAAVAGCAGNGSLEGTARPTPAPSPLPAAPTLLAPPPTLTSSPAPALPPSSSPSPTPLPAPSLPPVPSPTPAPAPPHHTRCGWIDDPVAEAAFVANAAQFNAIHPKWLTLDPAGNPVAAGNQDLPSIVAAARDNRVLLMPLVDADDADRLRLIINDAARITQHVQALAQAVHDHGWAGLDIDYEHLWSAADRPGMNALMTELSTTFHAAGYELSFALTALGYDDGQNGYDYQVLSDVCDVLHFMDYDYHWFSGDHIGTQAPLGWVDAAFARAETTGHADRFMLGIPNYAIGAGWWATTRAAMALCLGPVARDDTHMASCPYNVDTHYAGGLTPHCDTADHGTIYFEDLASMDEKLQVAVAHHARGATYWTLGDELDGFFALVHKYFP